MCDPAANGETDIRFFFHQDWLLEHWRDETWFGRDVGTHPLAPGPRVGPPSASVQQSMGASSYVDHSWKTAAEDVAAAEFDQAGDQANEISGSSDPLELGAHVLATAGLLFMSGISKGLSFLSFSKW
jgi:hypothetical protein